MSKRRKPVLSGEPVVDIPPVPTGEDAVAWLAQQQPDEDLEQFWEATHTVDLTDREYVELWLQWLSDRGLHAAQFLALLPQVRDSLTDANATAIRHAMELMDRWHQPAHSRGFARMVDTMWKAAAKGVKSGEVRRAKKERTAAKPTVEKIVAAAWRQFSARNDWAQPADFVDQGEGGHDVVAYAARWRVTTERNSAKVEVNVKALSGSAVRLKSAKVDMRTIRLWCSEKNS